MRAARKAALLAILAGLAWSAATGEGRAQEQAVPRIIAPERIAPPPVGPGPLRRAGPRPPLGPLGGPAPRERARLAADLYFRPVAIAAGRFESGGHVVTIAGIRVIDAERQCEGGDGGIWACGLRARTAFRYWLRGRAVDCGPRRQAAANGDDEPAVTLSCTLVGQDVGRWLTLNGWALAEPGGPYEAEGEAARAARRGIFGDGPARRVSGSG